MPYAVRVCSFVVGHFSVVKPGGKRTIVFEDTDQFGPEHYDGRKDEPAGPIHERNRWFWEWYPRWVKAGRPVEGSGLSYPYTTVMRAKYDL